MNELPNPTLPLSPLPRGSLHRPGMALGARPVACPGLEVTWARHLDEVRQAQRLRFSIFAQEMGARLNTAIAGHDVDLFDDYCEHLLVRDLASGEVIGTYRVLTPAQARRVGSTYSDLEFDLTRLRALRPRMVELGRSCVHAEHRHGGVILALWGALADFMVRNGLDAMIGCASIPMLHNGVVSGDVAASIWEQLRHTHLAPIEPCARACRCRCSSSTATCPWSRQRLSRATCAWARVCWVRLPGTRISTRRTCPCSCAWRTCPHVTAAIFLVECLC